MGGNEVSEQSDNISARIIDMLVQVIHKAAYVDKQPVDLGFGSPLSAAEVHLIDMAGRFPGDNISELAVRLGVTKGAVSQMVQKLESKRYVIRKKEEGNRKNIRLLLSQSGTTVYEWHRSLHECMDNQILSVLADLDSPDLLMILDIFTRLSNSLDQSLEIRNFHIRQFLDSYKNGESS